MEDKALKPLRVAAMRILAALQSSEAPADVVLAVERVIFTVTWALQKVEELSKRDAA